MYAIGTLHAPFILRFTPPYKSPESIRAETFVSASLMIWSLLEASSPKPTSRVFNGLKKSTLYSMVLVVVVAAVVRDMALYFAVRRFRSLALH
jgi:membrane protein DedA with SNARE-associated domain